MSGWIALSQPLYTHMPHGRFHDPPTFAPKRRTINWEGGSTEVSITEIKIAAHVGTHIDAPRHFFPGGRTIDEYPLDHFAGPGVILDVRREGPVELTAEELRNARPAIESRDIVLLYFGYAERYGEEGYRQHPYLANDATGFLVQQSVKMVGTDTMTPDFPVAHRRPLFDYPVHRHLLAHDVLIIENLGGGLKEVLGRRLMIVAFPLRIRGGDGSPVTVGAFVGGS